MISRVDMAKFEFGPGRKGSRSEGRLVWKRLGNMGLPGVSKKIPASAWFATVVGLKQLVDVLLAGV